MNAEIKIIESRDGLDWTSYGNAVDVRKKLFAVMTSGSRQHYLAIEKDGKRTTTTFGGNNSIWEIRRDRLNKKITDAEIEILANNMAEKMIKEVA